MKIIYKNPLTEAYQREYALYVEMCSRFQKVTCRSAAINTLALYYAELIKENKETGNLSYEAQYQLEDRMKELVDRYIQGHVRFPDGQDIRVSVLTGKDGLHTFVFAGENRLLAVRLKGNKVIAKSLKARP